MEINSLYDPTLTLDHGLSKKLVGKFDRYYKNIELLPKVDGDKYLNIASKSYYYKQEPIEIFSAFFELFNNP